MTTKDTMMTPAYKLGYLDGAAQMALNPVYAHRNGETELPEEEGWYWIKDGEWLIVRYWWGGGWSNDGSHLYEGAAFYGPIPEPPKEENDGKATSS